MLIAFTQVQPVEKPSWLDLDATCIGYSSNVGLYPLPATALPKARQWCRALQRQVAATWWATIETETHPKPDGEVVAETEAVMVPAALSVAAVQVLYEIFLSAFPQEIEGDRTSSRFEVHSHRSGEGKVVSGLKLIRNGEMHAATIVVPNVERTLRVPFTDGTDSYRVFPHWASYPDLPHEFREARHPPKKGRQVGKLKTNQIHHDHYESEIGEHLVVETLLDAFKFFAQCDPRIVSIDEHGDPRHFPLTPIVERDYERRHPDNPNRSVVENELRKQCESKPPGGQRRTLIASLRNQDDEILVHCGMTQHSSGYSEFFTETPDQVLRDVAEHNFPYWLQEDWKAHPVVADRSGGLTVDLTTEEPSNIVGPDDQESWRNWHYIVTKDAFQYANRRRQV